MSVTYFTPEGEEEPAPDKPTLTELRAFADTLDDNVREAVHGIVTQLESAWDDLQAYDSHSQSVANALWLAEKRIAALEPALKS